MNSQLELKRRLLPHGGGFTLVELLVVIGIVALLVALLMPTLNGARRQGRTIQCANNLRQLCLATFAYANAFKGKFPPNNTFTNKLWYQSDKLGKFLPSITNSDLRGPTVTCPEDVDTTRSYAMNAWASSDANITPSLKLAGTYWRPRDKNSWKTILFAERWAAAYSKSPPGWIADATVGFSPQTPGQRFGGGAGVTVPTGRGTASSELPYIRHRKPAGPGTGLQSIGAVNIGYADGHVALKTNTDLYDANSGKSTLDSLWSPLDPSINN